MGRTRKIILLIQRYGVPHEETVVIPSVLIILLIHQLDKGNLASSLAILYAALSVTFAGAWLGLAWENSRPLVVFIRTFYIGAIVSLMYYISTEGKYSAIDHAYFAFLIQ